jgi:hypothetical protein
LKPGDGTRAATISCLFDISSMGESALQSHMKGIFISLFLQCVKWCSSHLFRNLHFPGIFNWQWSSSLATDGWSRDVMIFYFHNFYFRT